MKKVYNKLVRDRIPRVIEADGHKCKIHEATPEEFRLKLNEKLQEEIAEFLTAPNAEEMADILEVLETMRKEYRIDLDDVRYQKESKMVNKGGFERKGTKMPFHLGGALGNRKEKINDLIRRML